MIKLIKPYISFEEVQNEFKQIFDSGWFTKGKFVEEFRNEIKYYTRAEYCYLTTSATTALTMALKAIDVKAGDEIILSDFSFPATSNVVEDIGATPIFADVDLNTFNMLPKQLECKITSKTKAVIFVDALGNPSGIHEIKKICEKYNLPLIEDGACAIGSSEFGVRCGNIADITCFSFHPRKLLTTGEGGAITFNDSKFVDFFEIKLNHGAKVVNGKFDFVDYGYNYRVPELQCVMGIKQVKKLDKIVKSRNLIREQYIQLLEPLGFQVQQISRDVVYNVQSLVFKVPENINRDELIKYLKQQNIESTIGTYCLSRGTYYAKKYNDVQPNAKYLEENTITLPCYDEVDIKYISEKIKEFV
ncbi:aminotransferase, DegT/DnrJ/EryC1/StrS family [Malaciobacter marinus]|uniref:Aminotransferase, DegT/DnrJ/EryC1/StrS family n=1 Tax=Malaciobacter marinus TaxID=505249 RepID=A0A347TJ58_9BACT|nr:DegT/DnrJ/EryC1/StrS aminotransferase family protein [Malaciobacter marinus]AXX86636.1 aminotransferase, DegT/DnrJ/EryC1/StrS family [Malaciobacter marinus]PHO14681.1 spore coat protein [Malaciobacter marinus]